MSHYAEKHPHVAPCGFPECPEQGTQLRKLFGRLQWVCADHVDDPPPWDKHK